MARADLRRSHSKFQDLLPDFMHSVPAGFRAAGTYVSKNRNFETRTTAMSKLTISLLAAMLLTSAPAFAAGLVMSDPHAHAWGAVAGKTTDADNCVLDLSIPSHISAQFIRKDSAFDTSAADNRWASGAAYQWNAGVNRAVDRLLMPPDRAQFHVTQTGENWRGNSEGDKSPNRTFAAFEVVLH